MILFIFTLIGLTGFSIWYIYQNDAPQPYQLPLLWGIALTLTSLLFLPWVTFQGADYFDTQLQLLTENTILTPLAANMPQFQEISLSFYQSDVEEFIRSLPDENLQLLATIARSQDDLTGFDIWRKIPQLSPLLWFSFLALLVSPLTAIAEALLVIKTGQPIIKQLVIVYGIAALLSLILILWYIPNIETFGFDEGIGVPLIILLSGGETASGVWWALLGLSLLSFGALLKVTFASTDEDEMVWGQGANLL